MIALIMGVFLFFWTHSALWFYREYKDRQAAQDPAARRRPANWRSTRQVLTGASGSAGGSSTCSSRWR